MVFPRTEGAGHGELWYNGYTGLAGEYQTVLEMDNGDGCRTM